MKMDDYILKEIMCFDNRGCICTINTKKRNSIFITKEQIKEMNEMTEKIKNE